MNFFSFPRKKVVDFFNILDDSNNVGFRKKPRPNRRNKMKLRKADVRSILEITFPEYKGRKYELEIVSETYLSNRDWAGGTHSDYRLLAEVEIDNKRQLQIKSAPDFHPAHHISWSQEKVLIPKNGMIVSHNYFCGHDCGIRIYISPDSIFLPKFITN